MDLVLHTDASYRNDLDTGKFARMLDDPSQCYKFYWLEAILSRWSATRSSRAYPSRSTR